MLRIVDKLGTNYAVDAKLVSGMIVYTVHADDVMVARAVFHPMRGCGTDVLVYREADRRRGIATALYTECTACGTPLPAPCPRCGTAR